MNPSRATILLIRPHQCDYEGGRIRGVLLYWLLVLTELASRHYCPAAMARSIDSMRPAVAPPHTEDLYTGTLALRVHVVHVVMPGRPRQTFICCVRVCVEGLLSGLGPMCTPASRGASMRWIRKCIPTQWIVAPLSSVTPTIE